MIPKYKKTSTTPHLETGCPFITHLPSDIAGQILSWCANRSIAPASFTRVAILHLFASLKLKTSNHDQNIPDWFKDRTPQPFPKKGG